MGAVLVEAGLMADDQAAEDFAAWVAPHLCAMTRTASRLVATADRDDVVQESLLRAWRRWSTYDPQRGRPLVWLLSIVIDQARRHRVRVARPTLQMVESQSVSELDLVDLDLEHALSHLSDRQRTVVDLYYFVDLDIATVAEVMGCAPGTVKATLHQARARLRGLVGGDDG